MFFFSLYRHHPYLLSFPTRRSSDLLPHLPTATGREIDDADRPGWSGAPRRQSREDRKSTRLNSSHANISYAVFCLKKKKLLACELLRFFDIAVEIRGMWIKTSHKTA